MDEREKQIRQNLKDDFKYYAGKCLKIRTKEGEIEPFTLNFAQNYIHEKVELQRKLTGKVRVIILKGRQQGCSTYVEGRYYWRSTHAFGQQAFILTHSLDATNNLYRMVKRYHENCPEIVRPEVNTSNSKELIFNKLDSGYKIGTAENKDVGRSSTIQLLHGSEVAFWNNGAEHAKGVLQAVPDVAGTEIFLESTANGIGNYFHQQWQKAEAGLSDFTPIFIPWFWQKEYKKEITDDFVLDEEEQKIKSLYKLTNEQLAWRRSKITDLTVNGIDGKKSFQQEYPNNPIEAFQNSGEDTFIKPDAVINARKCQAEKYGKLLIGVDPARYGDDRTSIIRRNTRCAWGLESYVKKSTMEVAGIVHMIIVNENPYKVIIDIVGLGAGVYDRLVELGHGKIVVAANGATTALNDKRYGNKRAEMWGDLAEWLDQPPVQIPDSDTLHADLCCPTYKFDSNGRMFIQKKEDIKKRGLRSPDEADALSLTFYLPPTCLIDSKDNEVPRKIMSTLIRSQRIKENRYASR